ncbi:MAG: hypothetical protein K2X66_09660, partial [Cyanobacteria bacterium]|nr:hypothetical protein [Cyanobacteriota bacterium]
PDVAGMRALQERTQLMASGLQGMADSDRTALMAEFQRLGVTPDQAKQFMGATPNLAPEMQQYQEMNKEVSGKVQEMKDYSQAFADMDKLQGMTPQARDVALKNIGQVLPRISEDRRLGMLTNVSTQGRDRLLEISGQVAKRELGPNAGIAQVNPVIDGVKQFATLAALNTNNPRVQEAMKPVNEAITNPKFQGMYFEGLAEIHNDTNQKMTGITNMSPLVSLWANRSSAYKNVVAQGNATAEVLNQFQSDINGGKLNTVESFSGAFANAANNVNKTSEAASAYQDYRNGVRTNMVAGVKVAGTTAAVLASGGTFGIFIPAAAAGGVSGSITLADTGDVRKAAIDGASTTLGTAIGLGVFKLASPMLSNSMGTRAGTVASGMLAGGAGGASGDTSNQILNIATTPTMPGQRRPEFNVQRVVDSALIGTAAGGLFSAASLPFVKSPTPAAQNGGTSTGNSVTPATPTGSPLPIKVRGTAGASLGGGTTGGVSPVKNLDVGATPIVNPASGTTQGGRILFDAKGNPIGRAPEPLPQNGGPSGSGNNGNGVDISGLGGRPSAGGNNPSLSPTVTGGGSGLTTGGTGGSGTLNPVTPAMSLSPSGSGGVGPRVLPETVIIESPTGSGSSGGPMNSATLAPQLQLRVPGGRPDLLTEPLPLQFPGLAPRLNPSNPELIPNLYPSPLRIPKPNPFEPNTLPAELPFSPRIPLKDTPGRLFPELFPTQNPPPFNPFKPNLAPARPGVNPDSPLKPEMFPLLPGRPVTPGLKPLESPFGKPTGEPLLPKPIGPAKPEMFPQIPGRGGKPSEIPSERPTVPIIPIESPKVDPAKIDEPTVTGSGKPLGATASAAEPDKGKESPTAKPTPDGGASATPKQPPAPPTEADTRAEVERLAKEGKSSTDILGALGDTHDLDHLATALAPLEKAEKSKVSAEKIRDGSTTLQDAAKEASADNSPEALAALNLRVMKAIGRAKSEADLKFIQRTVTDAGLKFTPEMFAAAGQQVNNKFVAQPASDTGIIPGSANDPNTPGSAASILAKRAERIKSSGMDEKVVEAQLLAAREKLNQMAKEGKSQAERERVLNEEIKPLQDRIGYSRDELFAAMELQGLDITKITTPIEMEDKFLSRSHNPTGKGRPGLYEFIKEGDLPGDSKYFFSPDVGNGDGKAHGGGAYKVFIKNGDGTYKYMGIADKTGKIIMDPDRNRFLEPIDPFK